MTKTRRGSVARRPWLREAAWTLALVCLTACSGCWAPFRSPAIPASQLPDTFRTPTRTAGRPLSFASLTAPIPEDYILGNGDILEVFIPGLYQGAETQPIRAQVMSSGHIHLPLVGAVRVENLNLMQAQDIITRTYADGYLKDPRVNVVLAQKRAVDVVVLGEVNAPGVYPLPVYQNDVAHALAAAGGFTREANDVIEVHRRRAQPIQARHSPGPCGPGPIQEHFDPSTGQWVSVMRIPLRGLPPDALDPAKVQLKPGDVVRVPSRDNEVFFVVGKLSTTNLVRFTLGDRERELGTGFVLPRDREVDVVTAVAMAGYIDPIDSPTTVTVHRTTPDGRPFLIHVDLIEARYDPKENILVQGGDIIYLNPDAAWWWRRTFNRVIVDVFTLPYTRWINGF